MARTASEEIRRRILDAAQERLWRYGFKKTTIDEIAADAGVGKGTVYLHFDSKEDVCLAIIAQYKQDSLAEAQQIARDPAKDAATKLTEMLALPVMMANRRCSEAPETQEMVIAMRPHFQSRLRPYIEHEYVLIAEVLEEGNRRGDFDVPDTMQAARTLKAMTHGLLPPYPYVSTLAEIRDEVHRIVALAVRGLRRCH
jgi:AcrR family transcriptional regulator